MKQIGSHWMYFGETCYLRNVRKSVEKIQVSLKISKNNGTLHTDLYRVSQEEWTKLRESVPYFEL